MSEFLFAFLFVCLYICLFCFQHVELYVCFYVCLSDLLSLCISVNLSFYLSVFYVWLYVCLSICLSIYQPESLELILDEAVDWRLLVLESGWPPTIPRLPAVIWCNMWCCPGMMKWSWWPPDDDRMWMWPGLSKRMLESLRWGGKKSSLKIIKQVDNFFIQN